MAADGTRVVVLKPGNETILVETVTAGHEDCFFAHRQLFDAYGARRTLERPVIELFAVLLLDLYDGKIFD